MENKAKLNKILSILDTMFVNEITLANAVESVDNLRRSPVAYDKVITINNAIVDLETMVRAELAREDEV